MQIPYDLDKKGIGGRLQMERERAGHTQESLADAMGITWKYISKVETGASSPSLSYIMKFSDIIGSDITYLLRGHDAEGNALYDRSIRETAVPYGSSAGKLTRKGRKVCNEIMEKVMEVLESNRI